jgi:hypothetical protein
LNNLNFRNSIILLLTVAIVSITIALLKISLDRSIYHYRELESNNWIVPNQIEYETTDNFIRRQALLSPSNITTNESLKLETDKKSPKVLFRTFLSDTIYHNTTVEGMFLPGPFHHDTIFLLGLRLSTSNEERNEQVHVDVFGFPGDFVGSSENRYCDVNSHPRYWNLSTYRMLQRGRKQLFCQLECQLSQDCGPPIPMMFIPLQSHDKNQNRHSLIWRCNVTKHLSKTFLLQHAMATSSSQSIRVALYINDRARKRKSLNIQLMTQIDIPLYTAVAGNAGPQIRPAGMGYFSPRQQNSSIQVGMCVSIYDHRPAIFIPEFLQHHLNVGIEQFMIGMDTNLNSGELSLIENVVRPYIDEGLVVLQAFGLKDYFKCDTDVSKLQFYHQCLYYFKGLTDYIVTWDVDEYWIPPEIPKNWEENQSKEQHSIVHHSNELEGMFDINSSNLFQPSFTNEFASSAHSSHSSFVRDDILWKTSNYSKTLALYDVIQAVNMYYRTQPGCKGRWCFHLFPSYSVARKSQVNRTNLVGIDFEYRDIQRNLIWRKGLVQTRFAMMNGFHVAGSCIYPETSKYYETEADPQICHSLYGKVDTFGTMHHFLSLLSPHDRFLINETDGRKLDEYVSRFGSTVVAQLERSKRLPKPLP